MRTEHFQVAALGQYNVVTTLVTVCREKYCGEITLNGVPLNGLKAQPPHNLNP